jgi:hypothetical protein
MLMLMTTTTTQEPHAQLIYSHKCTQKADSATRDPPRPLGSHMQRQTFNNQNSDGAQRPLLNPPENALYEH